MPKCRLHIKKKDNVHIMINDRYILGAKIGKGSFGEVYYGYDQIADDKGKKRLVAIKLEKNTPDNVNKLGDHEIDIYNKLYAPKTGLAKVFWSGNQGDYTVIVMEMIGPSLEHLLKVCGGKFSIQTIALLGKQMIRILSYIHSHGYVHRDIKPDNFLVKATNNALYIIDFGLCKSCFKTDGTHVPFEQTKKFVGTLRYASINSHKRYELSRRDDLESMLYVLIYLALGRLPWQSLKHTDKDDLHTKILECKLNTTIKDLCHELPEQFAVMLMYVRNLGFETKPNYNYLYGLMDMMLQRNVLPSASYEWNHLKK
jgi:serine/threonine protein kinase